MLKKFNKKIDEIFNRRIFFENTLDGEIQQKPVALTKSDFMDFYSNAYVIKKNEFEDILSDKNIILEAVDEVNFNQPVLDLLYDAKFGEQILPSRILIRLNKNWIYYKSYEKKSLKSNVPLYDYQFSFNDDDSILRMFYHLLPEYRKDDKVELITNFKNFIGDSLGFVTKIDEKAIIMGLNQPASKKTIAHELCHYFQNMIGVLKSKPKKISGDIGELHLSNENLLYLLNEQEFYPHIYVDMFADLKKFHHISQYSELSGAGFLNELFKEVEHYRDKIFKSKFGREWLRVMDEDSSLQILAACCYLNFRYASIKAKLKTSF